MPIQREVLACDGMNDVHIAQLPAGKRQYFCGVRPSCILR